MKVAIYARVSMEEIDRENKRYQEPENQLEPLRAWAKAQGWEIYKEYVDRGSGADANRKEFMEMLSDAMQRKFATILVWRVDRFSRERMVTVLARLQQLQARGVAVKSLTESWFDTSKDNPMADIIMAVITWASAEERRRISERTKAGIQRLKNIGAWKGGRRKGSKNKKNKGEVASATSAEEEVTVNKSNAPLIH